MGTHNLPASYDAWRTAPPHDVPTRASRYAGDHPHSSADECGDVTIDAIGVYAAMDGELVTVEISGRELAPHDVSTALGILCPRHIGPWDNDLSADKLRICAEAAQDAMADHADHLIAMRASDGQLRPLRSPILRPRIGR